LHRCVGFLARRAPKSLKMRARRNRPRPGGSSDRYRRQPPGIRAPAGSSRQALPARLSPSPLRLVATRRADETPGGVRRRAGDRRPARHGPLRVRAANEAVPRPRVGGQPCTAQGPVRKRQRSSAHRPERAPVPPPAQYAASTSSAASGSAAWAPDAPHSARARSRLRFTPESWSRAAAPRRQSLHIQACRLHSSVRT